MVKENSLETLVQDLENELKIKGWFKSRFYNFKNMSTLELEVTWTQNK